MKFKEKQKAIDLRKQGMSITDIARVLKVSKASVSLWVRKVVLSDDLKKGLVLKNISNDVVERRRVTRLKNEEDKRDSVIASAEAEIESLDKNGLKMAGIMLYLAEGGKTQRGLVRFSNSNPQVIGVMMKFFSDICNVPVTKFKGHIHTHSGARVNVAEEYWSSVTGIPKNAFFKTYIKPPSSSKSFKTNLPYGTFDIYVCDTNLFLKIKGWTNKILKLLVE
jgi:predicted transcriptional regulator